MSTTVQLLRVLCFEDIMEDAQVLGSSLREQLGDDNVEIKVLCERQEWDLNIHTADDIKRFHPDLIIVDLSWKNEIKKFSGMRVLRQLREKESLQDVLKGVPIVVWSKNFNPKEYPHSEELAKRVRDGGATPFGKVPGEPNVDIRGLLKAAGIER